MALGTNVTLIPARKHVRKSKNDEKPKLRVAAYCRVSTDSDEQATSYEAQIEHYTSYINGNPDWELAGIFADDGISGTNTKKRDEFNRMIEECLAGNIDMVITKSISRFARNTLDCLKFIRQLKDKNIPVFFEKENINSMDSKGEVMLTIMASLAQQESQSLSQNVKMGLQYRYQQGEIQVNCKWFLGYTKDENKHLVIVPEEAETVKRIYREYLEGNSLLKIARGLMADGIKNGSGRTKWHTSNVNQILRNEKYIGDALLQKTYTTDFLTKTRVRNHGIVPQYYVENSHEAIIPREIFMRVQEELIRRRIIHTSPNGQIRKFSSNHPFANKIVCGNCGEVFRRVHWNNHGKKSIVWRCVSRLENTGRFCDARTISETDLEETLVKAFNKVLCDKDDYLGILQENIQKVLQEEQSIDLSEITNRLEILQAELVRRVNTKTDYDDIADEIAKLKDEKQQAELTEIRQEDLKKRFSDMCAFMQQQTYFLINYDEGLVRRLIEKVIVDEDTITIAFKSGLSVNLD